MADIELVIKIPEEIHERGGYEYCEYGAISKHTNNIILDAFCNGTPLPKGHGALKDVDKLKLDVFEYDEDAWMWASITKSGYSKEQIESLETIIKADKEQEK